MSEIRFENYDFEKSSADILQENELLKKSLVYMKSELDKYKKSPALVADVKGFHKGKPLVKINNSLFMVDILEGINLAVRDRAIVEQRSLTVIGKLESHSGSSAEAFIMSKSPSLNWEDIAGNEKAISELKEVVELPLLKPELFKQIGINPPKGILLYGPPGCGKTMMAKALASSTKSFFIEITGSEIVQKYIGEGAKLVREIFEMARKRAPSIIFIDEIDSIASIRTGESGSGEREVQRTFIQLLSELDGFRSLDNVKVIAATNRLDMLDDALLRPGRLERQIEVDLPDDSSRLKILSLCTGKMKLSKVQLKNLVPLTVGMSGAELKGLCTEAGYVAIRANKDSVTETDFVNAFNKLYPNVRDEYKVMYG